MKPLSRLCSWCLFWFFLYCSSSKMFAANLVKCSNSKFPVCRALQPRASGSHSEILNSFEVWNLSLNFPNLNPHLNMRLSISSISKHSDMKPESENCHHNRWLAVSLTSHCSLVYLSLFVIFTRLCLQSPFRTFKQCYHSYTTYKLRLPRCGSAGIFQMKCIHFPAFLLVSICNRLNLFAWIIFMF